MARDNIDRARWLIMFVIAWLVGLYVYEIVQKTSIGFVAAVSTLGVNLYARKRAAACEPSSRAFKFWLYLPVTLFLVVPSLYKLISYLVSGEKTSWWDVLGSALPFVLKLIVPVAVLLWVYMSLGRLRGREEESTKPSAGQPDRPATA